MFKQNLIKVLPAIILSSLLAAAIIYAWQEPTAVPPGGNVSPPLHQGTATQTKLGGLNIATESGNVGIGTAGPAQTLEVQGDGLKVHQQTASAVPAAYFIDRSALGTDLGFHYENYGGTGDVVITNEGNVGIGTTIPGAKLHVAGDLKIDGSRIVRKSVVQVISTNYSATTAWKLGPSFTTITGFKAGSLVKLSYHIPMRNDSTSWGGGYIEPQISFNGGSTWNSLGSSGYDGSVMNSTSPSIGSYFNSILIDPGQGSDFSVTVRFYFRSYDGTVLINQSHDINAVSGTAALMPGVNGTQHYAKIIVEELY